MTENPIPKHLQSEHLLLLIGTNPLPNWVAARLLLTAGGCVHLIYSPGTKVIAERLARILADDGIRIERLEVSEADESEIYRRVDDQLKGLSSEGCTSIGLNYTGGTKMMSVHAHRAVRNQADQQNGFQPILSYLDARSLRLKFDGDSRDGYKIDVAPLVAIDFDKLLRLHEDFPRPDFPYRKNALGLKASKWLATIHGYSEGQRAWRRWCDTELKQKLYGKFRPTKELSDVTLLSPCEFENQQLNFLEPRLRADKKRSLIHAYEEFYKEFNADNKKLNELAQINGFGDAAGLAQWLDGQWLEHHTYAQVKECSSYAQINPEGVALNLSTKTKDGRLVEMDVVTLRGYQLFNISCYSGSDFKVAKLKLFEAMVRATQLGGDEARVALVSCIDTERVDDLRRQAESDWARSEQIMVYGRGDLDKLSAKLQNWFNGV
jgi:hypothetical protein